jgi:hypothetical protein
MARALPDTSLAILAFLILTGSGARRRSAQTLSLIRNDVAITRSSGSFT